jgi:hypothetical protein
MYAVVLEVGLCDDQVSIVLASMAAEFDFDAGQSPMCGQ